MTGKGLRIASASAAVLVSAAVAGAALYGGAALSDPREPSGDDRLIAVPAAPTSSPSETPSSLSTETPLPSRKATPSGDSLTQRARAYSRTHKCNIHQKRQCVLSPAQVPRGRDAEYGIDEPAHATNDDQTPVVDRLTKPQRETDQEANSEPKVNAEQVRVQRLRL